MTTTPTQTFPSPHIPACPTSTDRSSPTSALRHQRTVVLLRLQDPVRQPSPQTRTRGARGIVASVVLRNVKARVEGPFARTYVKIVGNWSARGETVDGRIRNAQRVGNSCSRSGGSGEWGELLKSKGFCRTVVSFFLSLSAASPFCIS